MCQNSTYVHVRSADNINNKNQCLSQCQNYTIVNSDSKICKHCIEIDPNISILAINRTTCISSCENEAISAF